MDSPVEAAAAAGMRWGALAASTTMLTLDRPLVGGTLGEAAVLPDAAALPGTMGTLELLDGGSGTGGVRKVGGV